MICWYCKPVYSRVSRISSTMSLTERWRETPAGSLFEPNPCMDAPPDRGSNRPPTIHDVAEAVGLHKSTVSLALSGKGNVSAATRARVRRVAGELGYQPNPVAQHLARGYRSD